MTNYRVFDGHCDTPGELWLQEKQLRSSDLAVSLDKAAGLGGYAQFFAFCTAWIETRMPHTEHFSRALDYFLAQLRREKGMTQKELAACLYVSDKAVSKWERGLSVPDISLLVPLAEQLNVTVAELLQGCRVEEEQRFTREETEELIRKALTFSAEPL